MLSISPPLTTPDYVLSLASTTYYTDGGEPLGRWHGSGAKALGLSGVVKGKVLRRLFAGLSPDGKTRLVQEVVVKGRQRQGGWDCTFSADKSVSTLWAVADRPAQQAIAESHEQAVRRALEFLQEHAGLTRRGKGAKAIVPAKLVWALFQHGTSRNHDPQLHTHCLLLNLGIRADGTTGAIVTKQIYRLKMLAGLVYRQELGSQLRRRLGLDLRQVRSWFEVEGVPLRLIERFSSRRQEVLAHLSRRGKSDAVSAALAAKATRKGKEHAPRSELFAEWSRVARDDHGFTQAHANALCRPFQRCRQPLGLAATVDELLRQQNYFSERQLLRRVLERNQATGYSADHILKAVRLALRNLVDLGVHRGERLFTSKLVLAEERRLLQLAQEGVNDPHLVVRSEVALKAGRQLGQTQVDALLHLTSSRGDLKILEGRAGTGKSTLLAAARTAWEAAGFQVVGGAYSGKAADELQKSAGISSQTVDRLLIQWAKERSAIRPLNSKSILVVDEAGMLDVFKLRQLFDTVRRAGAKLVLVGDSRQLPPIAGASPFAELGRRLGQAELREIHRQKDGLLKLVVENLADGDVSRALALLKHDRLLRLHPHKEAARGALVKDWIDGGKPAECLMLAATREEVRDLNLRAQAARAERAQVKLPLFSMDGIWFRLLDRVLFRENDSLLGVRNGSVGELTGFNLLTRIASVRLDTGKTVFIPVDRYHQLDLGYCLTVHKAQGTTVEKSYVLWSDSMQSRELTYVQASRARRLTRFYVTEAQAGEGFRDLLRDMERSAAKDLALTKAREARPDIGFSPSL